MFGTIQLIFAAAFALRAAALPAADPNDDASACWTSSSAYHDRSLEFYNSFSTELVSTTESVSTSTDTNVPLTTLCDGQARALERYKTIEITVTETLEEPTLSEVFTEYPEPRPTCTIAETACTGLIYHHHLDPKFCTTSVPPISCTADPLTSTWCNIKHQGGSTLLYWPVSGDLCTRDGANFAQPTSPPEPSKVVLDGKTFTSPTNYLSFNTVYAEQTRRVGQRRAMRKCGPKPREHVVVPITGSFQSGNWAGDATWSFDFRDLATVPAEAYSRQYKCEKAPESCTGVISAQADYTPIVVFPEELDLLGLEPVEWKAAGCSASKLASDMPMVALITPAPTVRNKMARG